MDLITKDEIEKLQFPGSASNGNNALRTLRRMFTKAKENKLILELPDFVRLGSVPLDRVEIPLTVFPLCVSG